uniref:Uncharacterized protein n=1 Tax=Oryza nivara TaxID=4536 RepID=A0A0E0FHK7_ORYNI
MIRINRRDPREKVTTRTPSSHLSLYLVVSICYSACMSQSIYSYAMTMIKQSNAQAQQQKQQQ